jgi:hypothetical protein
MEHQNIVKVKVKDSCFYKQSAGLPLKFITISGPNLNLKSWNICYLDQHFNPLKLLDIVQIHGRKFGIGKLWGWQAVKDFDKSEINDIISIYL